MTTMDENGNIRCIANDPFDLNLVDIKEDDQLIDFNGWNINLRVFNPTGNKTIIEITESNGIDVSIPGALRIKKTKSEMNISTGTYYYDWTFARPNQEPETWFNNKLFIAE